MEDWRSIHTACLSRFLRSIKAVNASDATRTFKLQTPLKSKCSLSKDWSIKGNPAYRFGNELASVPPPATQTRMDWDSRNYSKHKGLLSICSPTCFAAANYSFGANMHGFLILLHILSKQPTIGSVRTDHLHGACYRQISSICVYVGCIGEPRAHHHIV